MLTPTGSLYCALVGMTSASGRCHSFDASADGYVRSEGCGAVVLRRSTDLQQDAGGKKHAHAMVCGVSAAHDGRSASLTSPNGRAQARLIRKSLEDGNLLAHDVDYLEAHGTGTVLGDPIEMSAIAAVMMNQREAAGTLTMGAVKANIGHLEPGAGIAGFIKAVLVLQHEQSPPIAGLENLNPKVAEAVHDLDVCFPTALESLRKRSGKIDAVELLAGVSSFGFSGTIAHALLAQAPNDLAVSTAVPRPDAINTPSFPNRARFGWQPDPHPFLQQGFVTAMGGVLKAMFHKPLGCFYRQHCIQVTETRVTFVPVLPHELIALFALPR